MQQILNFVYPKDPKKVYDQNGKCYTIIYQGYSPDLQSLAPEQTPTAYRDEQAMQVFEESTGINIATSNDNLNQEFTNAEANSRILVTFANEDKNGDISTGSTPYSVLVMHSLLNLNTGDSLAKDCRLLNDLMDSWKRGVCKTGDYSYTLLLKSDSRYIFAHCDMKITIRSSFFSKSLKAEASSAYIIFFVNKRA